MRARLAAIALLIGFAPLPAAAERAAPDPAALESLLYRIEELRGLRFLRRPTIEVVEPDDERLAALRVGAPERITCLQDAPEARLLCSAPPKDEQLAPALARLLDAQHYPALVARAAKLPGDPGRAIRALLDASARAATTTGLGPPFAEPPPGILDQEQLEISRGADPDFLVLAATAFLRSQRDREAPFRDPPLSTRQLLRPRDYRDGVRPVQLRGAPPAQPDCRVVSDESVGAAALLLSATRTGATIPSAPLAAWRGDRAVQLACGDAAAWIYVVAFDDATAAALFVADAETFVPGAWARPFELLRTDRRVVAWHGVARDVALGWAARLDPVEIRSLDALE